jgi:hypothetical protein
MSKSNSWEKRIIDAFLAKYPASAAGQGIKIIRLSAYKLFPDFSTAQPAERTLFMKAVRRLERAGVVSLVWNKGREEEELSTLVCAASDSLFTRIGIAPPSIRMAPVREAALESTLPFFLFLANHLTIADVERGIDRRAVEDFIALARYMERHKEQSMTPRALSITLYADSKRLELLLGLFKKMLHRARLRHVAVPRFSSLSRSYPDTMVAGCMAFRVAGFDTVNESGSIFGLPFTTLQKISEARSLKTQTPSALSVENKETFFALSERPTRFDCLFYTGGYPNAAVQALASILAGSGFTLYHAGDLDIDGILILQELSCCTGRTITPFRMDGATFDEYARYGRKLHKNMLHYAHRISEETRSLPGISELVARIQETGMGIEQEIIDYTAGAPQSAAAVPAPEAPPPQALGYLRIFKKFFARLKL